MSTRRIVSLLLTLLAAGATIFAAPQLKRWYAPAATGTVVSACDLNRGPCLAALAGGQAVELSLTPRPIPLLKPFAVRLTARSGALPDAAEIDFAGAEMDMGFNRVRLARQPDGSLAGQASLPVCATGRMRWRADLLLDGSPTPAARFEFAAPESGK